LPHPEEKRPGGYDELDMTAITRRSFLGGAAFAPFASKQWLAEAADAAGSRLLYIGTQTVAPSTSKGIYVCRFDTATGALSQLRIATETANPTFLALTPSKLFLFAAHETDQFKNEKSGSVGGYRNHREVSELSPLNEVSAKGAGTCHVAVDHTGTCLFAANYTGGSAASFRISGNGRLSEAVSEFHYQGHGPNADRQEQSHAHRVTVSPDNRYVYVNDLGLDRIHSYRLDAATAALNPHDPPEWVSEPGSGPRALQFHPSGRWACCICELNSTVVVLEWNAANGALTAIQSLALLPEGTPQGNSTGCDIVFDSKGEFAYVANRGDDFIATLKVDATSGKLELLERTACGGKTPRHLTLDPSNQWLLVANQGSDGVAVLKRNPKTGRLALQTELLFAVSRPQCLVFG
jgi:6-phosphogluconolactonase